MKNIIIFKYCDLTFFFLVYPFHCIEIKYNYIYYNTKDIRIREYQIMWNIFLASCYQLIINSV